MDIIAHCRLRRKSCEPSTVLQDIIAIRGVLSYAKPGWDMRDVSDEPLREALPILKKERLISSARRRTQEPSTEQRKAVVGYFTERARRYDAPMADIAEFQYYSTRRISETCRVLWTDLDENTKTILVRDMKHPRHKIGNHRRVALPDEAFAIIMRQPRRTNRPDERIFPYRATTIKAAFAAAFRALGFDDLHTHDYRRGGITRLLAEGRSVQEVMLVTGQETPGMVLTTYNALKAEDFHTRRTA